MIVCVLYPRFELLAAVGDRRAMLSEPVALAPEAGREQLVGEVSAAAEAFGITAGMRVGEALARCPELRLAPPDPEGVRALWREGGAPAGGGRGPGGARRTRARGLSAGGASRGP